MHTLYFTHKTLIFKATFYSAIIYNFKQRVSALPNLQKIQISNTVSIFGIIFPD